VRVICVDANPAGPSVQAAAVASVVAQISTPGPERVPFLGKIAQKLEGRSFSFACNVLPTRLCHGSIKATII